MTNEELAIKIQLGHTEYYAELWEKCRKLLYMILRQTVKNLPLPNFLNIEDLQQEMYFALCKAAESYDDTKPWAFTSYLRFSVAKVLKDVLPDNHIAENSYNQIASDADGNETEYIELMEDTRAPAAFEAVELTDIQRIVREEVAKLPYNEQNAIVLHSLHNLTYAQIAEKFAVSPEHVQRQHHQGLRQLRRSKALRQLFLDMNEHLRGTESKQYYPHSR